MLVNRIVSTVLIPLAFVVFSLGPVTGSACGAPLPPSSPLDHPDVMLARAEALAAGRPYAFLVVNNEFHDLSGGFARIPGSDHSSLHADFATDDGHHIVDVLLGPSAFLSFGATTINFVPTPLTYSFLFATPITPGLYSDATSTAGVSLTNGASGVATLDNSANYPTFVSAYGTLAAVPTNVGVDIGVGPFVASGPPHQVTNTTSFGPGANSFAPATFDTLEVLLTYDQTDANSVSSWSGAVTLAIPEPSSMTVLAGAAIGLAMWRRGSSR